MAKSADEIRKYQREWKAARRAKYMPALGPCAACGSTENLQLDHKNRAEKVASNIWSWRESRILEELAKCQALCPPCHRKKTKTELSVAIVHGTSLGYKKGCRCRPCTEANTADSNSYRWTHGLRTPRN